MSRLRADTESRRVRIETIDDVTDYITSTVEGDLGDMERTGLSRDDIYWKMIGMVNMANRFELNGLVISTWKLKQDLMSKIYAKTIK